MCKMCVWIDILIFHQKLKFAKTVTYDLIAFSRRDIIFAFSAHDKQNCIDVCNKSVHNYTNSMNLSSVLSEVWCDDKHGAFYVAVNG